MNHATEIEYAKDDQDHDRYHQSEFYQRLALHGFTALNQHKPPSGHPM
jgi:hypothetical protein